MRTQAFDTELYFSSGSSLFSDLQRKQAKSVQWKHCKTEGLTLSHQTVNNPDQYNHVGCRNGPNRVVRGPERPSW